MIQIAYFYLFTYHISAFVDYCAALLCLTYYAHQVSPSLPTTEEAVSSYQPVAPVASQVKSIVTPPPQSRTHIPIRAASLRSSPGHCLLISMI